jgi:hypothetical protein
MLIMQNALPGINKFLQPVAMNSKARELVISCIIAFLMHLGKMSATQAAGAVRSQGRHRAQICRFLGRKYWKRLNLLGPLQHDLLEFETNKKGLFLFIVDQTICSVQAESAENSYHPRNTQKRTRKSNRKQKKSPKRSCHCFVMGLLITPSGIRIPFYKPFYTKTYCTEKNRPHRTQAEIAAEMIVELDLPETARVIVLGDTAFDAKVIREACSKRNFTWIVPINPERVLAGPKPRPKVCSLVEKICIQKLACIKVQAGVGKYVHYRRVSKCRIGPKIKPRMYYVHEESQDVHSVGMVRLLFSTIKDPKQGNDLKGCKILMTNDESLSMSEVIEVYGLRWQIELFFKEIKSSLGFSQYRFRSFEKIESWASLCLAAFSYLEWTRAEKLRHRKKNKENRIWWQNQRTHGMAMAVRQKAEEREIDLISRALDSKTGIKRIKKLVSKAYPKEYQARP